MRQPSADLLRLWEAEQSKIAARVVEHDHALSWQLDSSGLPAEGSSVVCLGCDVSFSTADESRAVVTLAAVELRADGSMDAIYSASRDVSVTVPYAPTFLAFREAPFISSMVQNAPAELRRRAGVLLLDGNGVLHPRKAGLACHVGVHLDMPTIGVGKTLMCMDGLSEQSVRAQVQAVGRGAAVPITGVSGQVWGNAVLTGNALNKPLFVSVGHRVSLDTATKLVCALCRYRVPEPIRLADIHSRDALRGSFISLCKI